MNLKNRVKRKGFLTRQEQKNLVVGSLELLQAQRKELLERKAYAAGQFLHPQLAEQKALCLAQINDALVQVDGLIAVVRNV